MTTPRVKKSETKSTANESASAKYDAKQVANWFIEHAAKEGKQLTIMHLLKFVYIAHGWHLGERGTPLFRNKIEAWRFGPVVPDVYFAFKVKDSAYLQPDVAIEMGRITNEDDCRFLKGIYDRYKGMSAWELSSITHEEGGPWEKARENDGWYATITDDLIMAHYQGKGTGEEIVT